MNRRFVHRWLRDWGLMLLGIVVFASILWIVTRNEILAGALVTAGFSLAMVAIGWLATR